jgi:PD-(D/E)XK endonuclease
VEYGSWRLTDKVEERVMKKDTSQKGLVSHTAVLHRLVQLSYDVVLPWADHLGYDLAYVVTEEHHRLGLFVDQECGFVRVQCKTARLIKEGSCLEFSTVSVTANRRGINLKKTYVGKAEYFGVYSPYTEKVYMISVNEAPTSGSMILRFKGAGLVRGNHKKTHVVPYEEIKDPRFHWAEDYEL